MADRRRAGRWCNNPKSIIVNVVFLAFEPPSVRDLQHCYCWQFRSLVCTSKVQCARRNLASNNHLTFVSSSDRGMFAKYTNSQVQSNYELQRCVHIRMIIIILLIKSALCFLHVHMKAVYIYIYIIYLNDVKYISLRKSVSSIWKSFGRQKKFCSSCFAFLSSPSSLFARLWPNSSEEIRGWLLQPHSLTAGL